MLYDIHILFSCRPIVTSDPTQAVKIKMEKSGEGARGPTTLIEQFKQTVATKSTKIAMVDANRRLYTYEQYYKLANKVSFMIFPLLI